jgi:hypothetical protein
MTLETPNSYYTDPPVFCLVSCSPHPRQLGPPRSHGARRWFLSRRGDMRPLGNETSARPGYRPSYPGGVCVAAEKTSFRRAG